MLHERDRRKVHMCSDSIAVLVHGVKSYHRVSKGAVVDLLWIAGHNSIRSNEIADNLARLDTGQSLMGPEQTVGISNKEIQEHSQPHRKMQQLRSNTVEYRKPNPSDGLQGKTFFKAVNTRELLQYWRKIIG